MNANTTAQLFPVELRIDDAGHWDYLIVVGGGSEDNEHAKPVADGAVSVWNDDTEALDLWIAVAPSEDRAPYDDALRAAGFEPVGDDAARRA
ncbi:hypothetical protein [Tsukamurella soli]|uniref:Uncharacterized protein n=1 Tax=Tsukamurella soli TaxID=644556 RepID=A0ABP8JJL2_9ACTN